MAWIKKHYDQFILILAAFALLGLSGLMVVRAKGFNENFAAAQATVVPSEKVPDLDVSNLTAAQEQLTKPAVWRSETGKDFNSNLFVPQLYMIGKSGEPETPGTGSLYNDSLTGKAIPNSYLLKYKLPLFDPTVTTQDPDKDGFTTEDEWRGSRDGENLENWHTSTNPTDANSHPPYVTKVFLLKWVQVPFRVKFQAYDGDHTKPNEMTFQINALDRGARTEFLKLGDTVAKSPYKLEKFEFKEVLNPNTGEKTDVSELTMHNIEENSNTILVLGKVANSPNSWGQFDFLWNGKPFQVKKGEFFELEAEKGVRYKLIDINDSQAVIDRPDTQFKFIVTRDPRKR